MGQVKWTKKAELDNEGKKIWVWRKGDYEAAQDTRSPNGKEWWYSLHYKGEWVGDFPSVAKFKEAESKRLVPIDPAEEKEFVQLRRKKAWKKYLKKLEERLRRDRS